MLSNSKAGASTSSSSWTPVSLTLGSQQKYYQHFQFTNLSSAAGWCSIDGGVSMVYLPAGIGNSNTIDTLNVIGFAISIQRDGATDITVQVAAF